MLELVLGTGVSRSSGRHQGYNENHSAITAWFLVQVIGAALLAPIGVLHGRIAGLGNLDRNFDRLRHLLERSVVGPS